MLQPEFQREVQILGIIEAIEMNLRQRRERIEEIQARHEGLALQYRQLGKSLDSATADLTQQFAGIIGDLGNDVAIAKLLARDAPALASASNLALEKPEWPPIPECVGEVQGTPNEEQVKAGFSRMLKKRRRSTCD